MKKIATVLAFAFVTIVGSAQENKTNPQEKIKKESCCSKKDSKSRAMSAEMLEKCQVKCKAEGKKCDAAVAKASGKKC
nr:hypothetical protein [Flavobacterium sp.]